MQVCYLSQYFSIFLLQGSLLQMFALLTGTLCNEPSVYPTFCNKPLKQWYWYKNIELWMQISLQAISVRDRLIWLFWGWYRYF